MPLGLPVEETLAHRRRNGGITLALRKLTVLESLLIVQNGLRCSLAHLICALTFCRPTVSASICAARRLKISGLRKSPGRLEKS